MPVEAVVTALRKMPAGTAGAGYLLELEAPGFEHRFEASSTRALEPGSRLVIRFIDHERARVEQVLERPKDLASPASSQALREALPRQQPVAEAYAGIARLLLQGSLPPEIRRHIERLLQRLPSPESLSSAPGLREAVENSGSFLESRLLRAPASPTRPPDASANDTTPLPRSPGTGAASLLPEAGAAHPPQTNHASAATNALSRLLRFFAPMAPSPQAASSNMNAAPPRAPDTPAVMTHSRGSDTLARGYDSRGLPDAPRILPGQPTTLAALPEPDTTSPSNSIRAPDPRLLPTELGTSPKTSAPTVAQSSAALRALPGQSFAAANNTPQPARAPTAEAAASEIANRAAPPTAQAANPAPELPASQPAARAPLYEANAAHQPERTNHTPVTAASLIATPLATAPLARGTADIAPTPGMPESTALPRIATQLQIAQQETANFINAPDKIGNAPYSRAPESSPTGRAVSQPLTKPGAPAPLIPAPGEIDSPAHTHEGAAVPRTSAPTLRGGAGEATPPTHPPAAWVSRGELPLSVAASSAESVSTRLTEMPQAGLVPMIATGSPRGIGPIAGTTEGPAPTETDNEFAPLHVRARLDAGLRARESTVTDRPATPRLAETPPTGQQVRPAEQGRSRENVSDNRPAPEQPPLVASPSQRHQPTPLMQDVQLRAGARETGSVAGFDTPEAEPEFQSRAQADGTRTNGSRARAPALMGRNLNRETPARELESSPLRSDLKATLAALQGLLNQRLQPIPTTGMPRAGNVAETLSGEDTDAPILYTARGFLGAVVDPQPGNPRVDRHVHGSREQRSGDTDAVAQLLRYVDGALARTRVHQLSSLPELRSAAEAASSTPAWVIELPIPSPRGFDSLWMRLEDQGLSGRQSGASTRNWQLMLCLDCAELGPLHARVELSGNRLGTTLWAEREGTLQAARAAVGELEEALRAQGVEVSRVDCRHGRPPESAGLRFGNLLDVRT